MTKSSQNDALVLNILNPWEKLSFEVWIVSERRSKKKNTLKNNIFSKWKKFMIDIWKFENLSDLDFSDRVGSLELSVAYFYTFYPVQIETSKDFGWNSENFENVSE